MKMSLALFDHRAALPTRERQGLLVLAALLSVGLFAIALVRAPGATGLVAGLVFADLVLCAWYDLSAFRVPNLLTYAGTALVLVSALLLPGGRPGEAVLGATVAGGFFLLLNLASRGKVGLADAKLAAFGGAFVGLRYAVPALFFGTLAAAFLCAVLLLARRITPNQPLPYAPFLSLGFVITMLVTGGSLGL